MEAAIHASLTQAFSDADIELAIEGDRCQVTVRSTAFIGKSRVQRHKLVYKHLEEAIANGSLHAVQITALAPDE